MAYREKREEYELVEGTDGLSGVRVFIDDPTGSTSALPVIGDAISSDSRYSQCTLQRIRKRFYGDSDHQFIYTCEYSTKPEGGSADSLVSSTKTVVWQTSLQIGGEVISVDGTNTTLAYKWTSDDSPIAQRLGRRVTTMPFTMSRKGVKRLPTSELLAYTGRVNNKTFRGIPAGQVLFDGCDATEYFNNYSESRWEIKLRFIAKRVPLDFTGTNFGGWLHLFRDTSGLFEGVTPYLYPARDLNPLIASTNGVF